ncbi:MAG: hypothetical protein HKL99_09005 [Burkholderiales bacterium]|jgi:hypothetical protein|nr:hypothetical protein [Burkholderiales bacterium]
MTIMTTRRSGLHKTPFGTIEFTHNQGNANRPGVPRSHRSQFHRCGLPAHVRAQAPAAPSPQPARPQSKHPGVAACLREVQEDMSILLNLGIVGLDDSQVTRIPHFH